MKYAEAKDKGYQSLETLVGLINEVVDRMQEADVPVPMVRNKLIAEVNTVLDEAQKKQMARWMDV